MTLTLAIDPLPLTTGGTLVFTILYVEVLLGMSALRMYTRVFHVFVVSGANGRTALEYLT